MPGSVAFMFYDWQGGGATGACINGQHVTLVCNDEMSMAHDMHAVQELSDLVATLPQGMRHEVVFTDGSGQFVAGPASSITLCVR